MGSTLLPTTAAEIAHKRLDDYLTEKLSKYWGGDDLCTWEFYTYLLKQAKKHIVDTSGYSPPSYLDDHTQALNNHQKENISQVRALMLKKNKTPKIALKEKKK